MENLQSAHHPSEPPILANTTNKAALLRRAKDAIDAGEQRLHEAAEALAVAQEDFKATQREIAKAVGRSASWVNRLLKWRQSGYKEHSPFGPTTTAGRVSHAKHRTKASKPRKASIEPKTAADDAQASAAKRKAEYARQETDTETTTTTDAQTPISRKYSPAEAKGELKYAIDHWWPLLDDAGKAEMTTYFFKKAEVGVS